MSSPALADDSMEKTPKNNPESKLSSVAPADSVISNELSSHTLAAAAPIKPLAAPSRNRCNFWCS